MRIAFSSKVDHPESFTSAIAVTKSDSAKILDTANNSKPIVSKWIMHTHGSAVAVSWKSFDIEDGVKEVSTVCCLAALGLDGLGFVLHDKDGSVAVWFDETGSTPDPEWLDDYDRAIKVDISSDTTDDEVAASLASALNGDDQFAASAADEIVTVTDAEYGARTDIADAPGDAASGFDLDVETEGGMYGVDFAIKDAPRITRTATLQSGVMYPIVTDQIMSTGTTPTTCVAFW